MSKTSCDIVKPKDSIETPLPLSTAKRKCGESSQKAPDCEVQTESARKESVLNQSSAPGDSYHGTTNVSSVISDCPSSPSTDTKESDVSLADIEHKLLSKR